MCLSHSWCGIWAPALAVEFRVSCKARAKRSRRQCSTHVREGKTGTGQAEIAARFPSKHGRVLLLDDTIDAQANDCRVSVPSDFCSAGVVSWVPRALANDCERLKRAPLQQLHDDSPIRCLVASSWTFHIREPIAPAKIANTLYLMVFKEL